MPSIEQSPRPHSAGKSVNFEGGGAGAGGSGAQGVRLLGLLPCQKKANDLAAILRRMQAQMAGGIVAAPSRSGRCLRSRRCRSSSASSCRAAEHSGGECAARRERSCASGPPHLQAADGLARAARTRRRPVHRRRAAPVAVDRIAVTIQVTRRALGAAWARRWCRWWWRWRRRLGLGKAVAIVGDDIQCRCAGRRRRVDVRKRGAPRRPLVVQRLQLLHELLRVGLVRAALHPAKPPRVHVHRDLCTVDCCSRLPERRVAA